MSIDTEYVLIGIGALICFPIALLLIRNIFWRLLALDSRFANLLSQKKSSEVRSGQLLEALAPMLADFPVDPHKPGATLIFLGQPIDYIYFDVDGTVKFIEVKHGRSTLSAHQKAIKKQVLAAAVPQVSWLEYRR